MLDSLSNFVSALKLQSDENVTQECRELLSTLPAEKGWHLEHLYQYQGFWYMPRYLQAVLNFQRNFQARDCDIILATFPKSGTTWLKALTFALVNRDIHPVSEGHHPLLSNNPHRLVPFMEIDLYQPNQNPDLSDWRSPRIFATHVPAVSLPESVKMSSCKIVYMCRDPKDTLVSLRHFLKKLTGVNLCSAEKMCDKFCDGICLYGSVWDHVLDYWNESLKNPDKVLFLRYEEMKQQPQLQLKRLAKFFDCPFSEEEEITGVAEVIWDLCSFERLSNLEANKKGRLSSGLAHNAFFRKGKAGDWKNHLTIEMAEKIDRITEQKFKSSGLQL